MLLGHRSSANTTQPGGKHLAHIIFSIQSWLFIFFKKKGIFLCSTLQIPLLLVLPSKSLLWRIHKSLLKHPFDVCVIFSPSVSRSGKKGPFLNHPLWSSSVPLKTGQLAICRLHLPERLRSAGLNASSNPLGSGKRRLSDPSLTAGSAALANGFV